jgi:hypothetical protein
MLKTTSGSSPRTDLSNNITFCQSQSHATVPLTLYFLNRLHFILTTAFEVSSYQKPWITGQLHQLQVRLHELQEQLSGHCVSLQTKFNFIACTA